MGIVTRSSGTGGVARDVEFRRISKLDVELMARFGGSGEVEIEYTEGRLGRAILIQVRLCYAEHELGIAFGKNPDQALTRAVQAVREELMRRGRNW